MVIMNKVCQRIIISLVLLNLSFNVSAYNIVNYLSLPEMIAEADHIAIGVVTGNMSLGRHKFSNVTVVHTIKGEVQDSIVINTQDNFILPELDCCSIFSTYLFFTKKMTEGSYTIFNTDRSGYEISKGKVLNFKGTDEDLDKVIVYLKSTLSHSKQ